MCFKRCVPLIFKSYDLKFIYSQCTIYKSLKNWMFGCDTHLLKHIKQAILGWLFRQNLFPGCYPVFPAISAPIEFIVYKIVSYTTLHCWHCVESWFIPIFTWVDILVYISVRGRWRLELPVSSAFRQSISGVGSNEILITAPAEQLLSLLSWENYQSPENRSQCSHSPLISASNCSEHCAGSRTQVRVSVG